MNKISNFDDLVLLISTEYQAKLSSFTVYDKYVVLIGYGSIGKRIRSLLAPHVFRLDIVSKHFDGEGFYNELTTAHLDADMIVIATETDLHFKCIEQLVTLEYKGIVYVEKPLVSSELEISLLSTILRNPIFKLYCGYNFRYHLLTDICQAILTQHSFDCSFSKYVFNENVSTWNRSIPWNDSYSTRNVGGGAVLTLSHAVDQIHHIFNSRVQFSPLLCMPHLIPADCNQGVVGLFEDPVLKNMRGIVEIGYHSFPGEHIFQFNSFELSFRADYKNDQFIIGLPDSRHNKTYEFHSLRDCSILCSLLTPLSGLPHSCTLADSINTLFSCFRLLS